MKQFEDINLNGTQDLNLSEIQSRLSENDLNEQLDEIKEKFLNESNTNDKYTSINKFINANYNKYVGLEGNLNNKKNSFIQAKTDIEEKETKKILKMINHYKI